MPEILRVDRGIYTSGSPIESYMNPYFFVCVVIVIGIATFIVYAFGKNNSDTN